jgi:D-threo-aldose 1-dehydrogenase
MSEIKLPKVVVGTSGLGNLYVALPEADKCAIVGEWIKYSGKPAVFDSAGNMAPASRWNLWVIVYVSCR